MKTTNIKTTPEQFLERQEKLKETFGQDVRHGLFEAVNACLESNMWSHCTHRIEHKLCNSDVDEVVGIIALEVSEDMISQGWGAISTVVHHSNDSAQISFTINLV